MLRHEGPRMGALAVLASLLTVATVSMAPSHRMRPHFGSRQRPARDTGSSILPISSQSQQQQQQQAGEPSVAAAAAGSLSEIITDCRLASGEQPAAAAAASSSLRSVEVGDREPAESQLSPQVMLCLNNCAHCVKQWKTGVYNGRHCADDCVQQASSGGGEQLIESMDPDCSLIKYFNATLLAASA